MAMRTPSFVIVLLAAGVAGCGGPAEPPIDASTDASTLGDDAFTPPASRPRWERYLRGDQDTRFVLELDSVAGAEPRASVVDDLVARLGSLLDKPGGIVVSRGGVIASRGADHAWTTAELLALGVETFDDDTTPGTVVMHVMWIDGHHADDSPAGAVLGQAWDHTHIVMFHETIESTCDGQPLLGERLCAAAQYGVWLHEVGHNLGLVDNGAPMVTPHVDGAHPGHDVAEGCIMYWAFEGAGGVDTIRDSLLGGTSVPDFDPQCLADLAAVRAR